MYKISFRNGENYSGFDIRVDLEAVEDIVMTILEGASAADKVKVTIEMVEGESNEPVSD